MAILSKVALSDTGVEWNKLSDPIEASGWYGRTSGLHTISFTLSKFVGRLYVLATLENSPEEADKNKGWFPIVLGGSVPWIEFPIAGDMRPALGKYGVQTSGTMVETFFGNFTYLKVGLERDHLKDSSALTIDESDKQSVGRIEQVLLNF